MERHSNPHRSRSGRLVQHEHNDRPEDAALETSRARVSDGRSDLLSSNRRTPEGLHSMADE